MRRLRNRFQSGFVTACALILLTSAAPAAQHEGPELKPGHPQRYTVQKGDTLWGIANKFLRDPWRWPEIWQRNQAIENPHLIFPGDVLVVSMTDGGPEMKVLRKRTVSKLSPVAYATSRDDAIYTVPPGAILPFLSAPLVIEEGELDDAGYVASGLEGRLAVGKYQEFYGRGLETGANKDYQIFRPGRRLVHPETDEFLGVQALHVGNARVVAPGETTRLEATRANLEISPGDRMLPAPEGLGFPYFMPRAPSSDVRGLILDAPLGVAEVGPLSVVIISLGEREGMEPGHVLRIHRQERPRRDPVTGEMFTPPPLSSGLLMVFRTFEKVSYALVLNTTAAVHIKDALTAP